MMRHFYTAMLVLALAAFSVAQAPAPTPQEPTTRPPSDTTQQPGMPPSTTPPTFPDTQQEPAQRPESDTEPMVDDQALQTEVHQQFSADPAFRNVQVTVEKGKVRLEGTVASKEDKKRAKEMAKSMTGVRKVSNKLKVDEQMAAAMGAEAGTGAEARPESDVTGETQVTQPSTTPPSTVPQSAEPQTAQPSTTQPSTTPDTAQPQSGQTPGDTMTAQAGGELKAQIETALKNEPTLTGTNVIINVSETTVELSGSVPTGKERQTAKRIAQSFAGNRRVEDRMTVTGMGQDPSQTNQPNQTPPPTPPNF